MQSNRTVVTRTVAPPASGYWFSKPASVYMREYPNDFAGFHLSPLSRLNWLSSLSARYYAVVSGYRWYRKGDSFTRSTTEPNFDANIRNLLNSLNFLIEDVFIPQCAQTEFIMGQLFRDFNDAIKDIYTITDNFRSAEPTFTRKFAHNMPTIDPQFSQLLSFKNIAIAAKKAKGPYWVNVWFLFLLVIDHLLAKDMSVVPADQRSKCYRRQNGEFYTFERVPSDPIWLLYNTPTDPVAELLMTSVPENVPSDQTNQAPSTEVNPSTTVVVDLSGPRTPPVLSLIGVTATPTDSDEDEETETGGGSSSSSSAGEKQRKEERLQKLLDFIAQEHTNPDTYARLYANNIELYQIGLKSEMKNLNNEDIIATLHLKLEQSEKLASRWKKRSNKWKTLNANKKEEIASLKNEIKQLKTSVIRFKDNIRSIKEEHAHQRFPAPVKRNIQENTSVQSESKVQRLDE